MLHTWREKEHSLRGFQRVNRTRLLPICGLLLVCLLTFMLAGCRDIRQAATEQDTAYEVTDAQGTVVKMPAKPLSASIVRFPKRVDIIMSPSPFSLSQLVMNTK